MLKDLSFSTLTTTANNLWDAAKNYVFTPEPQDKITEEAKPTKHSKSSRPIDIKRLLILSTIGLFNAARNQAGLSLGLATLFVDSVNAAYPTVANPIPNQYAQPGQAFSYDIDLNQVFNDADRDIMTFGGVTMADGSSLPSWMSAGPILLGHYDTPGSAQAVAIQNDVAYIADLAFGVQIIDVSNASNPTFLGNYITSGSAYNVECHNSILYAIFGGSGLQLINVSDPSNPRLISSHSISGLALDITVQNGVAYMADYTGGLQLINVSNITGLALLGNILTLGKAYGVTVLDNIAYIADGNSGLQMVNVTNVSKLQLLGNYNTPGNAYKVRLQNTKAYVADYSFGVQIIDVSNVSRPVFLSNYDTPNFAYDIRVQNNLAYVADYDTGILILNVTNSTQPVLVGSYNTSGHAQGLIIQNELLYVADDLAGLQILNLSQMQLVGAVPLNATGSYHLKVDATNILGEWITTDLELRIGVLQPFTSTSTPTPTPSPVSSVSLTAGTNVSSNPYTQSTGPNSASSQAVSLQRNSSIEQVSNTQTSSSSFISAPASLVALSFDVVPTVNPISIEIHTPTKITVDYFSVTGNVNPNQVILNVQGNNPDVVFTVNGTATNLFTYADVQGGFVELTIDGTYCNGATEPEVNLQASVAGTTTQVDVDLIFEVTSSNCNGASQLGNLNMGLLLLIIMDAVSLLANKNNLGLCLGLTLLAEPVGAAYPTVANLIPTQFANAGERFNFEFDLNQIFTDPDGDILSYADFKLVDGNAAPVWIQGQPKKIYGKNYANDAQDVDVFNGIAYVANYNYGLINIFNVTDPTKMEFLGNFDNSLGNAYGGRGVRVQWPYVYVVGDYISVVDVSNPLFPLRQTELYAYNSRLISNIALSTKFMFIQTEYDLSTQIYSIEQPAVPKLLSVLPSVAGLAGTDQFLYTVNSSGFYVYDLFNASAPNLVGFCNVMGNSIAINNNYAFVIADYDQFQIINITNPFDPVPGKSLLITGQYANLAVNGPFAFAADIRSGGVLTIFNISDVTNPTQLPTFPFLGTGGKLAVQGNIVYQTNGAHGLALIDISNPLLPNYTALFEDAQDFTDIVKVGTNIYIADNVNGVFKMDISDLSLPIMKASNTESGVNKLVINNNVIYSAFLNSADGDGSFRVMDASSQNFTTLGMLPVCANNLFVNGSIAYLTCYTTLSIVDVSNITGLSVISSNTVLSLTDSTPTEIFGVVVSGTNAYVAAGYGDLSIYDVKFPSAPLRSTILALGFATYLTFKDPYLFVSVDISGVAIFELRNASNLLRVGTINSFTGQTVVNQNLLYACGGGYIGFGGGFGLGFQIVNIANLSQPVVLGTINTPGSANNLAVSYPHIFVADAAGGLQIYDSSKIVIRGLAQYTPNSNGNYNFTIYGVNQKGEMISTVFQLHVNAPRNVSSMPISAPALTTFVSNPSTGVAPMSTVTTNPSSLSTSAPAPQSSAPIIFSVSVSPMPIAIILGTSITLTTDDLSFSGNVDPNQVVFTVQGNNPDVVFTVNGVETSLFTYADIQGGYVALTIDGTYCDGASQPDVALQAKVAGTNIQTDVSLVFEVTSTNCNKASRLGNLNMGLLLTTTGLGFLAKGRDKRQSDEVTETQACISAIQLKN